MREIMKSYKIIVIQCLSFILLVSSSSVLADEDNSKVGTRVFSFLKIPIGARPMAMGGAFTGVADDEASLYYNPAGVASLDGKRFIAGYHNYIFDMQSGFLGYIHPISNDKKVSIYINYLNYGDFIRTSSDGTEDGTFSGSDMLFGAGYAINVNSELSLGGVVKFIYEKIDNYSSTGFAVDLGAKYTRGDSQTSFGLMVQNLGKQLGAFSADGEKYPLPVCFRGGFSSSLKGLPILFAADVILPTDNDIYFSIGGEFLNLKPLYLRLGWTNFGSNYKTGSSKDDLAGFSAGFGIEYHRMQISYTVSPEAELGTSHRITFTGALN